MAAPAKKRPLIDKLLILGAISGFVLITVMVSPMLWMATLLAALPVVVMVILIQSTIYLNVFERQTEENREK